MPSLLRDDPNPDARAQAVRRARDAYVWDHAYLAPLPMLKIPGTGKNPGILEFFAGSFLELPPDERPDDAMPRERLEATSPGVLHIELDHLRARLGGEPRDPDDYLALIEGLHTPSNLIGNRGYESDWDTDAAFVQQRLAGPNPMVIARPSGEAWRGVDARLGLEDAHLRQALGEGAPTVEQAVAAGILFVCDYGILADPTPLPCGSLHGRDKHLPAPIAAFAYDSRRDAIVPVAIRLGQSRDAPLRVRGPGEAWRIAKAMVSVADFNHHEMGVHLALTHFVQEGIAVATHRSLPPQHPVAALLAPHFKYLLFNNFAGRELLVQPGGYVEKILAGELASGSLEIVRRFYARFSFDDLDVPAELARRNVMSLTGLPRYPYRDDALLLWPVIDTWVRNYLAAWYPDDATVAADTELARWCAEMTAPEGAHLAGFPAGFDSVDALARALTKIIFLAGPHHAAVNYPQNLSMLPVPNMPGASWAEPADTLLELLPPLEAAHAQVQIIWTLTCYQYGRLGQYGAAIDDPRVAEPLATFQQHLRRVEEQILSRNTNERAGDPYLYLLPSRIPNSTNV